MPTIMPDPWVEHAIQVIFETDEVNVTLEEVSKDLIKFGRNRDIETASATIMTLPDGVDNETYVSSNLITTIVSDNAGDTEEIVIEGHTLLGGNFTFVEQTATLTGTTPVTLTTPLARSSRNYNNGSVDLLGNIYVTEDDTFSLGVPDTSAKVHLMISAGQNQSEKVAVTISSTEYWVVTNFRADMISKTQAFGDVGLEIRRFGNVFRQVEHVSCNDSHPGIINFKPYLIVYPNSDIRLRGISDSASGRDVFGSISGVLLKIAP